jgi:hypothetical protein
LIIFLNLKFFFKKYLNFILFFFFFFFFYKDLYFEESMNINSEFLFNRISDGVFVTEENELKNTEE